MSATVFRVPNAVAFKVPVLVVQPEVSQLASILSVLASLRFDVILTDTFKDAKLALARARPALLIPDIRLREYNGLHLLLRARAQWPDLPAVITSPVEDPVLRRETERNGGTFAVLPTSAEELSAAICRTLLRPPFESAPIRAPFERRAADRRQRMTPTAVNRRSSDRRRMFSEAFTSLAS
jgi:DNA-binding NtrC family response regulator